jgi:hypothetical protein
VGDHARGSPAIIVGKDNLSLELSAGLCRCRMGLVLSVVLQLALAARQLNSLLCIADSRSKCNKLVRN